MDLNRRSLIFAAPREVAVQAGGVPEPGPGELRVRAAASAISAGSELLLYRGDAPDEGALDEAIPALQGGFAFPLRYGYALAGSVDALGQGVDPAWLGRAVFAFHPHDSHAVIRQEDAIALPAGVPPELGVFIPNLETAVNLVMDGAPLLGERVVVFGQGVVGLLVTALLARFPLGRLVTVDALPARRAASRAFRADASLDPGEHEAPRALLDEGEPRGADLVFELSGNPAALDAAIAAAGFAGRIVIGSWYGRKRAALDLGGRFHRNRQRLISSQVSTIAPELRGRWTKARRFETVLALLPQLGLEQLISHRFPIERAAEAYVLLDQHPDEALQVLLTY
ncbi:MAG TPA: zinc-binding alcohol dehydrogenase [Thermomicrobiaceae bacterium]|nr:zinc-binding alcohol dehydrogenase [Thermomicrobiaceae bacterium]